MLLEVFAQALLICRVRVRHSKTKDSVRNEGDAHVDELWRDLPFSMLQTLGLGSGSTESLNRAIEDRIWVGSICPTPHFHIW
jgi:hypothetical protein